MTVNFVNLTPHPLTLLRPDKSAIWLDKSDDPARVSTTVEFLGELDGMPLRRTSYGPVVGLPEPQEGTIYIVSSMVLSRITGRDDVVAPDNFLRIDGVIKGARALRQD